MYSIDHVAARLAKAESIGAIPIDLKKGLPSEQIMRHEAAGVMRIADCVGFECVNVRGEPQENFIINDAIALAAVAAKNSYSQWGVAGWVVEKTVGLVMLPVQAVTAVLTFPFRTASTLFRWKGQPKPERTHRPTKNGKASVGRMWLKPWAALADPARAASSHSRPMANWANSSDRGTPCRVSPKAATAALLPCVS